MQIFKEKLDETIYTELYIAQITNKKIIQPNLLFSYITVIRV